MLNTWDNVHINTSDRIQRLQDETGFSYTTGAFTGQGPGRSRFGRGRHRQGQYTEHGDRHDDRDNYTDDDYIPYSPISSHLYNITNAQKLQPNRFGTIILDIVSTSYIAANENIIHNVHVIKKPLKAALLGGVTSIKQKV